MSRNLTKSQRDGLLFLLLGGLVFILLGGVLERASAAPMADFRVIYYSARCLIHHEDPYVEANVLRIYQAESGDLPLDNPTILQIVTRYTYLPTAFSFIFPISMLPWGVAHLLWIALSAGGLILGSILMWDLAADHAPILSGCLIGYFLANCEVLMVLGNSAGIAVSACIVGVWCIIRERFVFAGLLCLSISLLLKPQDASLVWVYFLLAGGAYTRRALQIFLLAISLGLPGVLWTVHVAPQWMQEWHANVSAFSARGGMNDPGPASSGGHGLGMLVNLQSVFSVFRDDPRIYNLLSYLVCAPLLLVLGFVTLRFRDGHQRAWLALAALSPLSMLPVYHHLYDAKLLLLTVPACAMLWAEGGKVGRVALIVTSAAFVLTGDLTWAAILSIISSLHLPTTGLSGQILIGVQVFPAPFALLIASVFYLWIYVQRCFGRNIPAPSGTGKPIELEG